MTEQGSEVDSTGPKAEKWTLFFHRPVRVITRGDVTSAVLLDGDHNPVLEFSVTLAGKGPDIRRQAVDAIGQLVHDAVMQSVRSADHEI